MSYPRSLADTDVVRRWCVIGSGPDQDEAPWRIYAQTYWGLSSLSGQEFSRRADAVAFLDTEIIPLWPGGLRTVPQWTVTHSDGEDQPFALAAPTSRGRCELSQPRFERAEDAKAFLLHEITPLGRLDEAS